MSFQQATSYSHYSSYYYDSDYSYEFLILVKIIRSQSRITFVWANTNSKRSRSVKLMEGEVSFGPPFLTCSAKLVEEAGNASSRRTYPDS
jgi:hypothetical protein